MIVNFQKDIYDYRCEEEVTGESSSAHNDFVYESDKDK